MLKVNIRISISTLGALTLFLISANSVYSGADIDSLVVVDGAVNLKERISDDGSRTQISYDVELKYPEQAIGKGEEIGLELHGWFKCSSSNPGWVLYTDASQIESKLIHSLIGNWVKNYDLMTISSRYVSKSVRYLQTTPPDNSIQHILILVDEYENEDSFEEVLRRLEISCLH